MTDLERKFYARHMAAVQKEGKDDLMHYKYISKKRGPNGKWQYKYRYTNRVTGTTDHEYKYNQLAGKSPKGKTSSYEVIDDETQLRFSYDAENDQFNFDFADGYTDSNAQLSGPKQRLTSNIDEYTYTYTRNGKQYETTMTVTRSKGVPYPGNGMKTRDVTKDTLLEKGVEKVKSFFN